MLQDRIFFLRITLFLHEGFLFWYLGRGRNSQSWAGLVRNRMVREGTSYKEEWKAVGVFIKNTAIGGFGCKLRNNGSWKVSKWTARTGTRIGTRNVKENEST